MRRKTKKQLPKIIGAASALALCVGVMGYMAVGSLGKQVADQYGCYDDAYQRQTVVIVDASEPRWDKVQGRALKTYFEQIYNGLSFNEKLSIYTSEGDKFASIAPPRIHVCGQAKTSDDLKSVNAPEAQAGYLKRQKERLFEKLLKPELDELLSLTPEQSRRQLYESPIMEMIRSVSRSVKLESGDRLIVISDMIQNSESAQFCRTKNNMPRFSVFKTRRIYQERLKPHSLAGVEAEFLMLMRAGYGKFCSGEGEIRAFWSDYFKTNKANPNFIRIRTGG